MQKLFFLVSGEYESLSVSELFAILEAEGYPYTLNERLDQTVRLEADARCIQDVKRRSGYTRVCAQELFACNHSDPDITAATKNTDFTRVLSEGETFEVRIRRIKEYSSKDDTMHLERLLGKLILQNTPHAKVNLSKPDKTFYGILTNGKLIFGVKLAEIEPKPFVERRPRKKPFFHPSAMNAKMARCMVNLAHAKSDGYVLDPFCGTGTTLLEATLIGCRAVGVDVQRRMANGAKRNLKHFGLTAEAMLVADARKLPLLNVDCIVTDPPYGKSATTLKSTTKTIVEATLDSAQALLSTGQRICIASPKTLGISKLGKQRGFRHIESHFAYVHSTLTREVAVFEKE
ncbi:MAG: DNA methyltransferase [Candidatus Bathyarchaeota archaeon]|nr:DNA methyltransferase [Candidatus Bathyarchaeota archaeon]